MQRVRQPADPTYTTGSSPLHRADGSSHAERRCGCSAQKGTLQPMDHADSDRSTNDSSVTADSSPDGPADDATASSGSKRRRGSRGGQRRRGSGQASSSSSAASSDVDDPNDIELPKPMSEGRPSAEAAEKALVRKPRIGDTMPMPTSPPPGSATAKRTTDGDDDRPGGGQKRRRRSGSKSGSPIGRWLRWRRRDSL